MSDPFLYSFPSPLAGFEDHEPLSDELNEDGKSFKNPQTGVLSESYEKFSSGIRNDNRGGFDIHIYYHHSNEDQMAYAKALWKRIRLEFPELRIYRVWDKPVGPHYLAMFEVNVFTPAQFGAFIPWLVINRGPLSALVHPNHEDEDAVRDHSQRATWLGERVPVDLGMLKKFMSARKARGDTNGGT